MSDTIKLGDVRPGDIVLLRGEDDPLDNLIKDLDGSPYTHAGLVIGPDLMANARTANPKKDRGRSPVHDLGGVRRSSLSEFRDRAPHILRPTVPVDGALEYAHWALEVDVQDTSDYSFAKLFIVSVALRSFSVDNEDDACALREAAFAAADQWQVYRGDEAAGVPAFYCSELVAEAFQAPFALADFDPGPARRVQAAAARATRPVEAPQLPAEVAQRIQRVLEEPDEAQLFGRFDSLLNLVWVVIRHDFRFFRQEVKALIDFVKAKREAAQDEARDEASAGAGAPEPAGPPPLPGPLVTPRMLLGAAWVEPARPITF